MQPLPDDLQTLRSRGARMTLQRTLVLGVLRGSAGHHDIEAIHSAVACHYPLVHRATIYRILEWLHQHKLVSRTAMDDGRFYYEYIGDQPHHHLICSRCGMMIDVDDSALDCVKQVLHERYGFDIQLAHLAISGVCPDCRTQPAS